MNARKRGPARRRFLQSTAAGAAALAVVPRNVLGRGQTPPSEEFGGALIGAGGIGGATFKAMGPGIRMLARCDVRFRGQADDKTVYTDYRRVMDRPDIDVVAVATPPHWHALISRGHPHPKARRRARRGLAPLRHAAAPGEHRHPLRAEDPLRPRPGADHRRRGGQPPGPPADARAVVRLRTPASFHG